jgi:hypothetical protein
VTTTGVGGRVLYSPDGSTFKTASLFGLDLIRDLGYRAMVCWQGRLWIAPSGTFTITAVTPTLAFEVDADIAFNKVLLVNDKPSDPFSPWQRVVDVANAPQLGDPDNQGIWSLGVFGDALYLGVTNGTTGFEIWKADGATCAPPPGECLLTWEKLIDNGGGLPVPPGTTPTNDRVFHSSSRSSTTSSIGASRRSHAASPFRRRWVGSARTTAGTSSSGRHVTRPPWRLTPILTVNATQGGRCACR